jgi:hypothetical protein
MYQGFRYRVPIGRGLSYNIGSFSPLRESKDILKAISNVEATFTNQRIVLNGEKKSITISKTSLLDCEYYTDGIVVKKTNGKSILINANLKPETIAIVQASVNRMVNG